MSGKKMAVVLVAGWIMMAMWSFREATAQEPSAANAVCSLHLGSNKKAMEDLQSTINGHLAAGRTNVQISQHADYHQLVCAW